MENNNKILFLVDHKHRDLPALSLIAYYLNRMNCNVRLVGLGLEEQVITEFDPQVIVIPKPNYSFERMVKWKIGERKIVIIESEGNPQDLAYKINIRIKPDLYLFWNEIIKERYLPQLIKKNVQMKVLGYYRSDFLHKNFHDLLPSRKELLIKYGLNPDNKTITIATSTQDSHFSEERIINKKKRRNRTLLETADFRTIVQNSKKLRIITEKVIKIIVNKFPDINVAIKPHPNENAVFWHEFVKDVGKTNLGLVVGEPINNLFAVSDLHISHNVCTTTIEGLMFGLPTVEIHTDTSRSLFAPEHLNIANYLLRSPEDIEVIVGSIFYGKNNEKILKIMNETNIESYVKKYFAAYDGCRCYEYGEELSNFVKNNSINKKNINHFFVKLKWISLYFVIKAKNKFVEITTFSKKSKIEKEVNSPKEDNKRKIDKINGFLVDYEYGLFDNRMKSGDENAWYQKYNECAFIKDLLNKDISVINKT